MVGEDDHLEFNASYQKNVALYDDSKFMIHECCI